MFYVCLYELKVIFYMLARGTIDPILGVHLSAVQRVFLPLKNSASLQKGGNGAL